MSKKDAVKSKINAFIVAMGVILTALFAVIGYAFVNYETISSAKWYAIVVALVVLQCFFTCAYCMSRKILNDWRK